MTRTLADLLSKMLVWINIAVLTDGTRPMQAPLGLNSYTVATLPSVTTYEAHLIWVSDETGGATVAFSDGTNWRRVQDYAVVS